MQFLTAFNLTPNRIKILGLLVLIAGLLLISWYEPAAPPAPVKEVYPTKADLDRIGAALAAARPADPQAREEASIFAGNFSALASRLRLSSDQHLTAVTDGQKQAIEFNTAEQSFNVTRAENDRVLLVPDRRLAWAPFFEVLNQELKQAYRRGDVRQLTTVASLWDAVAAVLDRAPLSLGETTTVRK